MAWQAKIRVKKSSKSHNTAQKAQEMLGNYFSFNYKIVKVKSVHLAAKRNDFSCRKYTYVGLNTHTLPPTHTHIHTHCLTSGDSGWGLLSVWAVPQRLFSSWWANANFGPPQRRNSFSINSHTQTSVHQIPPKQPFCVNCLSLLCIMSVHLPVNLLSPSSSCFIPLFCFLLNFPRRPVCVKAKIKPRVCSNKFKSLVLLQHLPPPHVLLSSSAAALHPFLLDKDLAFFHATTLLSLFCPLLAQYSSPPHYPPSSWKTTERVVLIQLCLFPD